MNYSQFLTDVHVEYNSLNCVVLLDGKYIKIINGKIWMVVYTKNVYKLD